MLSNLSSNQRTVRCMPATNLDEFCINSVKSNWYIFASLKVLGFAVHLNQLIQNVSTGNLILHFLVNYVIIHLHLNARVIVGLFSFYHLLSTTIYLLRLAMWFSMLPPKNAKTVGTARLKNDLISITASIFVPPPSWDSRLFRWLEKSSGDSWMYKWRY